MTMMLEHGGQNSLKISSMIRGAIFSPPAVIISSLILPVMNKKPSLSIFPRSPL